MQNRDVIKTRLITLSLGMLAIILVLGSFSLLNFYINRPTQIEPPQQTTIPAPPSQYPDWDAIKGQNPDSKIKVARITDGCPPEVCRDDRPATIGLGGIHKRYRVVGKLSRAYLYIEALVDYRRPLTVWDDFYFKVNGFGGHLVGEENTLAVPPSDVSRYLYDLRAVSYYPSIGDKANRINKQTNINLFNLLQDSAILDIIAAISSDRAGRVMKEVSIYYECSDGPECNVEEIR